MRRPLIAWQRSLRDCEISPIATCERSHKVYHVGVNDREDRRIPEASVARLPLYLRCLAELTDESVATVSSVRLAEMAGVNAAKVRKDLSYLGSYGTRGVGYEVEYLTYQIRRELGLTHDWPVIVCGLGNLGQALANYGGFGSRGYPIAGLIDADPAKVGTTVHGHKIHHIDGLEDLVRDTGASIGIVATPAEAAQSVVDRMAGAGIKSILNFAPAVVSVPDGVSLRKVDLAVELQILSYYQERETQSLETTPDEVSVATHGNN